MIERDLLIDMGFTLEKNRKHEVWYSPYDFWVHYGQDGCGKESDFCICGDIATRKEFCDKFLDHVRYDR